MSEPGPDLDFTPPDISLRRRVALIGALAMLAWLAVIGVATTLLAIRDFFLTH